VVVYTLLVINIGLFFTTETLQEGLDSLGWLMLLAVFEYESTTLDKPYSGRWEKVAIWAVQALAYGTLFVALHDYVVDEMWLEALNATLWLLVVLALLYDMYAPGEFEDVEWRIRNGAKVALYGGLAALVVTWAIQGEALNAYDALLWLLCFFAVELNVLQFEEA
jgi:hypothetical protein